MVHPRHKDHAMINLSTACRLRPASLIAITLCLHFVATASAHAGGAADLQRRVDELAARLDRMAAVIDRLTDAVERLEARSAPAPVTAAPLAAAWPIVAESTIVLAASSGPETLSFWEGSWAAPRLWLAGLRREELQSIGLGLFGLVTLTLASIACVRVGAGIASDPARQAIDEAAPAGH
jgi:hypothetical protein